jgi:hypothetical protein
MKLLSRKRWMMAMSVGLVGVALRERRSAGRGLARADDPVDEGQSSSPDLPENTACTTLPEGSVTSFTYDCRGLATDPVGAQSHTTTYVYDAGCSSRLMPDSSFIYDGAAQPEGTHDHRTTITTYTYDGSAGLNNPLTRGSVTTYVYHGRATEDRSEG